MSRRGENIYKRRDGRWEGRFIKGYDERGKALYNYVYSKSYREVRDKLSKAKEKKADIKIKETLDAVCNEWLILSRNRVKESTFVKYSSIVNKHLTPYFKGYLLENISTVTIEVFTNRLLVRGLSRKTVKDILTVLRGVLKYAGKKTGGRLQNVEIIYPKEQKKEMRVLSVDEQKRFTEFLLKEIDGVKFGILLALFTGMRIGEVCALKWRDICIEEKVIKISSTMQRLQETDEKAPFKTKVVTGDAKTESSKRIIPLTEFPANLCKALKREDEAYLLTGDSEKYMEPRSLQYRFKKYTEECNLEGVHFHCLRHTFATRCVEVGFEIKSLSEILGHSSPKVTLERYVHSSMELKRSNMEKLSAVGF